MKILGIETSCDETAAALVENGNKVLSSSVASSEEIHKKYGGIIPEKAAREQLKSIIPVIKETLLKTDLSLSENGGKIDAIAVTVGPGLIGSLLVGVETGKTLAYLWNKPIIPVNHLIAHFYGNFIGKNLKGVFPAIGLIVSGGHTELILVKSHSQFQWLGGTRDDAAGEAFDKTARLLGLGYPGGPAISKHAAKIKKTNESLRLPRPMINKDNLDFSFSGLKTAVLRKVRQLKSEGRLNSQTVNQLSHQIEQSITDVLVKKTLKATEEHKVKSILIGGGVAANQKLREKLKSAVKNQLPNTKLFIPDNKYCTDNAVVIASVAYFDYSPIDWREIKPNPGLEITDKLG